MSEIRKSIQKMYSSVEMPGGWKFNHISTLKTIDLFYMSKYATGDYDDQGFYKLFYNIGKPTCDVASKFIDIDVQNWRFIPRPTLSEGSNELAVYHFAKDFAVYADEEKLGQVINQFGDDLPKYGSIFAKDVRGSVKRVAPHNIKFDPSARNLRDSGFVAEAYLLREDEILSKKWNKLSNFELVRARGKTDLYLVYEYYENYGKKWKRQIVTDVFAWKDLNGGIIRSLESNINYQGEELPPVVLHEDEVKLPYYDHKWEHVDGRLLGYGNMEYLIPNQIALNEAENLERKGLYYSSLVLLQTRDTAVGGKNVLTSSNNGDILTVDSEISKVPMEERNLAAYNATRSRWDENTMKKTFATDVAQGNNLPSRTPLGVANLQAGMVTSFFDKKRENYGMFWKELTQEIIIPSFKNKTAKEHMLTIGSSDEDIAEYEKMLTDIFMDKAIADYYEKNGYFPSIEQRKAVEERIAKQLRSKKYKNIIVPDNFYDNLNYKLHIDITGEGIDTGVKSQIMQIALTTLAQNPAVLQNKATRSVFFKFLSMGGVTPSELGLSSADFEEGPMPQRGGSLPAPTAPSAQQGAMQMTV